MQRNSKLACTTPRFKLYRKCKEKNNASSRIFLSKIINKDDLKTVVFEEYKQSLYESLPARIYAVRKAKGYILKF